MTKDDKAVTALWQDILVGHKTASVVVGASSLLSSWILDAPDAIFLRSIWFILLSKMGYMYGVYRQKLLIAACSIVVGSTIFALMTSVWNHRPVGYDLLLEIAVTAALIHAYSEIGFVSNFWIRSICYFMIVPQLSFVAISVLAWGEALDVGLKISPVCLYVCIALIAFDSLIRTIPKNQNDPPPRGCLAVWLYAVASLPVSLHCLARLALEHYGGPV